MSSLRPEPEQLEGLVRSNAQGPFVMISLLKFKETAPGEERPELAYARYLARAMPHAEKVGARMLWYGDARQVFVGASSDGYDRALLVEYPSRSAFAEMLQNPDYTASLPFRDAALARMVMLVGRPIGYVPGS
jgi:uncharacterized protein (DUF1330 family)